MSASDLAAGEKVALGKAVGEELLRRDGRKRFYSAREVKAAATWAGYPPDQHAWAMALFMTPADFTAYQRTVGETCNYVVMKRDMLAALTDEASQAWFDIDLSWLDWPEAVRASVFER